MEFSLYPCPTNDIVTPFVYSKTKKEYSRLFKDGAKFKTVKIKFENGNVMLDGLDEERLFGKRIPERDKLLEFVKARSSWEFIEYVENNYVMPAFALSPEEALVRTIIKQVISARQAKKLMSDFIKAFGSFSQDMYAFPSKEQIESIEVDKLQKMGLGFKSKRIVASVAGLDLSESYTKIPGIGRWSAEMLNVEFNKDYCYYPFWDISSDKISRLLGFDTRQICDSNRKLAADLHLYSLSYFERN